MIGKIEMQKKTHSLERVVPVNKLKRFNESVIFEFNSFSSAEYFNIKHSKYMERKHFLH